MGEEDENAGLMSWVGVGMVKEAGAERCGWELGQNENRVSWTEKGAARGRV